MPGSARPLKLSAPAQPLAIRRGSSLEARCHHAHKHQQFENRQQGDDQFEGGGNADAEDVQRRHQR